MIRYYSVSPNDKILQLQFRVYVDNLKTHGSAIGYLTRLLLDNPSKIFPADIHTFNHILEYLPHFFTNTTIANGISLIINNIMKMHGVSYNERTFQILHKLLNLHPHLRKLDINQPSLQLYFDNNVRRILQRLKQIEFGMDTNGYINLLKLKPKARDLIPPDPFSNLSKRRFDGALRDWRRKLHAYDHMN